MTEIRKAPGGAATFLRFAWQQLANRKTLQRGLLGPPQPKSFAQRFENDVRLSLSAADGWVSSGIQLAKGDSFTVAAEGVVWISKSLSVGATPATALWARIGRRGRVQKMRAEASNFRAWSDGELEFCLKPPGEWLNDSGDYDPDIPRLGATGLVEIAVILWRDPKEIAVQDGDFAFGARGTRPAPDGWSYLWRLGESSIYGAQTDAGKPCIHVQTRGNVGILQYPIEAPLDASATLEWRWLIDKLPSALPEHIQPTHDYLSIAVEFDNGQDLTYFWSSELPVDTVFKCPLPWWDKRETHWVVRSGPQGLGEWRSEKRNLRSDYEQAIGGALPAKIVRVWLIANSVFQRRQGEAKFADIAIAAGGKRTVIV